MRNKTLQKWKPLGNMKYQNAPPQCSWSICFQCICKLKQAASRYSLESSASTAVWAFFSPDKLLVLSWRLPPWGNRWANIGSKSTCRCSSKMCRSCPCLGPALPVELMSFLFSFRGTGEMWDIPHYPPWDANTLLNLCWCESVHCIIFIKVCRAAGSWPSTSKCGLNTIRRFWKHK